MSKEIDFEARALYSDDISGNIVNSKLNPTKVAIPSFRELSYAEKKYYRQKARAMREATHIHYKGGLYQFLHVATYCKDIDGSTDEAVVYRHVWPEAVKIWITPKDEFFGMLPDGRVRFRAIDKWNFDWSKPELIGL